MLFLSFPYELEAGYLQKDYVYKINKYGWKGHNYDEMWRYG
jgi:hypothetical protein